MEKYKKYYIDGGASPVPHSQEWRSEGMVFGHDQLGLFVVIDNLI